MNPPSVRAKRIIAYPKSGSAYTECFYRAAQDLGAEVVEGVFSGRWILQHVKRGNLVHFHWPSYQYVDRSEAPRPRRRFLRFAALLVLMRARGARIVWTAHNLLPHERSASRRLDVLARRALIALSNFILVHGPTAAAMLKKEFPSAARKLRIIDHGNWIQYYERSVSRQEARGRLGVANEEFVYLFIGFIRRYKNIESLIEAFHGISGRARLIIAGSVADEDYRRAIVESSNPDHRVSFHIGMIPHDEMQVYMAACDAVVIPYREILTSGTAMLAMSFGRPVVSIRKGYLIDVIDETNGILYDPEDGLALRRAMSEVRAGSFDEAGIVAAALKYSWRDSAMALLDYS